MSAKTTQRRAKRKPPLPLGATVEIQRATGAEPELVRQRAMLDAVCGGEFVFPKDHFSGRGIVICGGGEKYFPSVYVCVRLLRHLGCGLPIEVWHLGKREMSARMRGLLEPHGVVCVDALEMRRARPARRLAGWELKCYAVLHSSFAEVLLLDADNCPVRDPAFLFDTAEYGEKGAIFWPDFTRFAEGQAVWVASGVAYRDEWEFESGQMVIDKARCWRALGVAMHLNEHSDWWYRVVHGDKDTFHLAWRKIGQDYAMPAKPVAAIEGTMLQYDFAGRLLFQHRNFAKWKVGTPSCEFGRQEGRNGEASFGSVKGANGAKYPPAGSGRGGAELSPFSRFSRSTLDAVRAANRRIHGFRLEEECLGFLAELHERWHAEPPRGVRRWDAAGKSAELVAVARELCAGRWHYERVGLGGRAMAFLPDGRIGEGAAACEMWWTCDSRLTVYGEDGRTFTAVRGVDGVWRGAWERFEKAAVVLSRMPKADGGMNGGGRNGKNGHRKGGEAVSIHLNGKRNGRVRVLEGCV